MSDMISSRAINPQNQAPMPLYPNVAAVIIVAGTTALAIELTKERPCYFLIPFLVPLVLMYIEVLASAVGRAGPIERADFRQRRDHIHTFLKNFIDGLLEISLVN